MFNTIKNYIIAFFGAVIAVLFGLLKYEKFKKGKIETELQNSKVELEIKDIEGDIREFEALNKEKAKRVENENINTDVKPNTKYEL